jgi:phosphatidylinositol 4-kinase type 2
MHGFQGEHLLCEDVITYRKTNVITDASDFLRNHPWPGRSITDTFDDSSHRASNLTKRFLGAVKVICGRTGAEGYDDDADIEYERVLYDASEGDHNRPFYWSAALQQSFREELEK